MYNNYDKKTLKNSLDTLKRNVGRSAAEQPIYFAKYPE